MRISTKGQVTIPQDIRERLGMMPNTEVRFEVDGDTVRISKVQQPERPTRGQLLVARLKGTADVPLSTEAIMALTRD